MGYKAVTPAKKGCKYCGSKTVAWETSEEGKWYLVEVFTEDGVEVASRTDFHSTYCGRKGDPSLHAKRQAELDADAKEIEEDRKQRRESTQAEQTDKILKWYSLPVSEIPARIAECEKWIANFNANPPTMDYMVEFNRETAERKMIGTELAVLEARLRNER